MIIDLTSFFFQAEDGIRDLYVTGVQTCALPILLAVYFGWLILTMPREITVTHDKKLVFRSTLRSITVRPTDITMRSEERRVGKECRYRWCVILKKNKQTH